MATSCSCWHCCYKELVYGIVLGVFQLLFTLVSHTSSDVNRNFYLKKKEREAAPNQYRWLYVLQFVFFFLWMFKNILLTNLFLCRYFFWTCFLDVACHLTGKFKAFLHLDGFICLSTCNDVLIFSLQLEPLPLHLTTQVHVVQSLLMSTCHPLWENKMWVDTTVTSTRV